MMTSADIQTISFFCKNEQKYGIDSIYISLNKHTQYLYGFGQITFWFMYLYNTRIE